MLLLDIYKALGLFYKLATHACTFHIMNTLQVYL